MGGKVDGKGNLRFAVSAPGCIEFEKNVVLIVDHNIFVAMGHNDLNSIFLFFRNWLRLDAWLDFAVNKILHECTNVVHGKLLALVIWELLVLDGFLDGKGGPFVNLKVEIAGVSTKGFCVDGCEADCAFVFLSERLESLGELSALLWSFGENVS